MIWHIQQGSIFQTLQGQCTHEHLVHEQDLQKIKPGKILAWIENELIKSNWSGKVIGNWLLLVKGKSIFFKKAGHEGPQLIIPTNNFPSIHMDVNRHYYRYSVDLKIKQCTCATYLKKNPAKNRKPHFELLVMGSKSLLTAYAIDIALVA